MNTYQTKGMDRFEIEAMMKVRDETQARVAAERKAREPIDPTLQVFRNRFAELARGQNI